MKREEILGRRNKREEVVFVHCFLLECLFLSLSREDEPADR